MTTIVFDMADPGVKAIVDGWADDTEYEVTIKVRAGAGENRNVGHVVSMEAEESDEAEMETEEAPAVEAPKEEKKSGKTMPPIKY